MNLLHTIMPPRKRVDDTTSAESSPANASATLSGSARELADALEVAMVRGQWGLAERIARTALRLAPKHLRLTECIARLRLVQGQPGRALAIIDCQHEVSASMRLLSIVCLLQVGRKREAHLDLYEWSREQSAPLDARSLLALLDWDDADAATQAMQRNLRQIADPTTLQLMMLLKVSQGQMTEAQFWADQLMQSQFDDPVGAELEVMVQSLGLKMKPALLQPTADQAAALAEEIIELEHAIPALVEAHRISLHRRSAIHLAIGIAAAIDQLNDRANAIEQLVALYQLLGEQEKAVAWATRGLEENPMSATLSRIVREATVDDAGPAPTPDDVSPIIGQLSEPTPPQERAA